MLVISGPEVLWKFRPDGTVNTPLAHEGITLIYQTKIMMI